MHCFDLKRTGGFFIRALALVKPSAFVLLVFLGKLKRGIRSRVASQGRDETASRRDPRWVLREIERLCSGEDPDEPLFNQMTSEDRALFDVCIIDSLNKRSREDQQRLRSTLINHGYDEQCARRVMSEDFSDQVRASTLLNLLRPQLGDTSIERDQPPQQ